MPLRAARIVTLSILFITGGTVAAALISAIVAGGRLVDGSVTTAPAAIEVGRFLLDSFREASVLIALFPFACGWIVLDRRRHAVAAMAMVFATLVVPTAATAAHLAWSAELGVLPAAVARTFGRASGTALSGLLVVLELLIVAAVARRRPQRAVHVDTNREFAGEETFSRVEDALEDEAFEVGPTFRQPILAIGEDPASVLPADDHHDDDGEAFWGTEDLERTETTSLEPEDDSALIAQDRTGEGNRTDPYLIVESEQVAWDGGDEQRPKESVQLVEADALEDTGTRVAVSQRQEASNDDDTDTDPDIDTETETETDPETDASASAPQTSIETAPIVVVDQGAEPAQDEDAPDEPPAIAGVQPGGYAGHTAYEIPLTTLESYDNGHRYWEIDEETQASAGILQETLSEFNISAEVTGIRKGPVITMFEILPAPGVKISKIVNLADNIALRLAASRVRIVAPIPGKHAVGIEVPNRNRAIVSFREIVNHDDFTGNQKIPVALGKDIAGECQVIDLTQTPHLLIAGATGSGKSVCVNSIICSIIFARSPAEVRLLLIDPKIVELKFYNDIPHLLTPVITEPKRAFQALQYCVYEMERRYSLLDSLGVRDIASYNKKISRQRRGTSLPYIVIVVDEFADLMATSGKELESTLARLAAMSRAVGIHIVLATQRPSIDVITGLIKANIPTRIAFMVAGKFDSRIIIDTVGAEKLLGKGDMLFVPPWDPHPVRIQGAFLSEDEVERVTDFAKELGEPDYVDEEIIFDDDEYAGPAAGDAEDPLADEALDIVLQAGKASASYLQRKLKIGYNRAARLVEDMEARGIVGPPNGSKPREIIHVPDRAGAEVG